MRIEKRENKRDRAGQREVCRLLYEADLDRSSGLDTGSVSGAPPKQLQRNAYVCTSTSACVSLRSVRCICALFMMIKYFKSSAGWWSNKLSTADECDKWDILLHLWVKTLNLNYYILNVMFSLSWRWELLCGRRTSILLLHMENQYWTVAHVNCHCGTGGWRISTSNRSPGKFTC